MSYMTTFNLEWDQSQHPSQEDLFNYISTLRHQVHQGDDKYQDSLDITTQMLLYGCEDPWYDCHEHMTLASIKWPHATFTLNAQGEEHDDTWRAFYHNGRSALVTAKKVYPDFNPASLNTPHPSPQSTLQQKLDTLHQQVQTANSPSPPRTQKATDLFRSLYGHAPNHLSIEYTGLGNIAITAGDSSYTNLAIFVKSQDNTLLITTLHGRTTVAHHGDPLQAAADHRTLACLRTIDSAVPTA